MILSIFMTVMMLTMSYAGIGPMCDEVVQKVAETDSNTDIPEVPPIPGTWVSDKCEVRPGPEYLLRWHWYSENGTYSHNTFVYLDDGCSKPVWSRCIKGRYSLHGKSYLIQGTFQADFTMQEVMVIIYSRAMAQDLSARANTSCPGVVVGRWMPEVEYIVYKHHGRNTSSERSQAELEKERSCMNLLKLSYEDVGLVRIQERPSFPFDSWGERQELLIGETRGKVTIFHDALVRANQTSSCQTCQLVKKSTLLYPPILQLPPPLPIYLTGEWVSTRCEIYHNGLFLRRRLRVSGRSWHAEYWFYADPLCEQSTLLAAAEGSFSPAGQGVVAKVQGASDFDFTLQRAFLTVFEKELVVSLQEESNCGPPGVWEIGVARDLTPSGGCPALGIKVPSVEYELIRIESDASGNSLLFLGQSDDDRRSQSSTFSSSTTSTSPKERPTHFQPPLMQCASPEFPLTHFLNSNNFNGVPPCPIGLGLWLSAVVILLL